MRLIRVFIWICVCMFAAASAYSETLQFIAGTITPAEPTSDKDSQGIYLLEYDTATQSLGGLQLVAPAKSPSFAVRSGKGVFYFTSNAEGGSVAAFDWHEKSRSLIEKGALSSGGGSPAYVALNPVESHLLVANYMGANLRVYAIDKSSGALLEAGQQTLTHTGKGADPRRQEAPHPHWVQWNRAGDRLYAVDLGTDKVMMYPFSADNLLGSGSVAYETKPGAGPRHMAFHPRLPFAYIINELDHTLTQVRIKKNGLLEEVSTIETLRNDYQGPNLSAHIAISRDGKTLYASNRGHNSIAVVKLGENGEMKLVQSAPVGGNWPRFFLLVEDHNLMLVANQLSDSVTLLEIAQDGKLKYTGKHTFVPGVSYLTQL